VALGSDMSKTDCWSSLQLMSRLERLEGETSNSSGFQHLLACCDATDRGEGFRSTEGVKAVEGATVQFAVHRRRVRGIPIEDMPSFLQREYRAGGRVHTPSRVAPPVGRHQLPQGSSKHHSLTYLHEMRMLSLSLTAGWILARVAGQSTGKADAHRS